MEKLELIVAVMIAVAAALVALGLYLLLFELTTGKLRPNVSRDLGKALSGMRGFLRRRLPLVVVFVVAVALVALAMRFFDVWSAPIEQLIGGILRRER
jgi:hypothetical protein